MSRYKARREENLSRQDVVLFSFAKAIGHHGLDNFIEGVQQRYNTNITPEYAAELLTRAGYEAVKD